MHILMDCCSSVFLLILHLSSVVDRIFSMNDRRRLSVHLDIIALQIDSTYI